MSKIVRAEVTTNSTDDKYARVRIHHELFWDESPLVCSIGGIPLKVGDLVFVDISNGAANPIILGRATGALNQYHSDLAGSLLFESSDGSKWTFASVDKNSFRLVNSEQVEVTVNGSSVEVSAPSGTLKVKGKTVVFDSDGAFCALPRCMYTGVTHVGNIISLKK